MKIPRSFLPTLLFVGIWCGPFLSVAQQSDQQAAHQRTYNNCLHGYSGCDLSQLTDAERMEVQQAAHRRNYNNCLHGYSGCDLSQLTDAERMEVRQAAHRRNYNNCLHGYSGCDLSQLSSSEREAVSEGQRNSGTSRPAPSTSAPPRYYTNKNGQRVQSPTYSDTIPSGATAQCRDGTYSFSRNHRGTCSHHGGVARWLD
jgi:uncharacterized protein DUF3761